MPEVKIYHNISRDADLGLNMQVTGLGKRLANTREDRHQLVLVFTYTVPEMEVQSCLEAAFQIFNVGVSNLAKSYRSRKLRNLSVGDVVTVDGLAYSCEKIGWKGVRHDLRIIAGAEAEAAIRASYGHRGDEELSVTVPLEG